MKIMALNGSPNGPDGNTARILGPLMEGAAAAGADCATLNLYDYDIRPCRGCYACWTTTPGECVIQDDMAGLLEQFSATDIAVIASPLYVCGLSAATKLFLDRIIPTADPHVEIGEHGCYHPPRGAGLKGMALVSNCGFHELHHFDELVAHVKAIARISGIEYLGSLLRPHGPMLPVLEQHNPAAVAGVYDAARQAGEHLGRGEAIPADVCAAVTRELLPREAYLKGLNDHFDKILGVKP